MTGMNTYLTFDGNCDAAMKFYAKCLDAQLDIMPFSATPCDAPAEVKDRIAHAKLTKGPVVLMASDTMPGHPFHMGNNFSVALALESDAEIEKLFKAFSEKGKVTMELQDTFWGARFGMITDQFGINWMFNYDKPKK